MKKVTMISALVLTGLCLFGMENSHVKAATVDNPNSVQMQNNNSDVNNYINQNNLPYSGVKDETAQSTFTKLGDYRHGKPEGIVIHETAKQNISAQQWADIYNNEWQKRQTYVHAFVDHNHVVQIAPTDKTVWGAGYYANQRFIQVELCEENNEQDFAQSVQNDATYVASLLHQYNLKPILADNSGQGTIWSHHDVSRYLGDTDHTDPDGYFASHNYSMSQFFDLVKQRYDAMAPANNAGQTNQVAKDNVTAINDVVKITYNGLGKVAVWSNYGSNKKIVKYLPKNTNWKAFKVASFGGHQWYNLGGNQWVDGQYITPRSAQKSESVKASNTNSKTAISSIKKIVTITYHGPGKVAVWDNFDKPRHLTKKYLASGTNWKAFKVASDADGHQWYNLGGNQWIDASYIKIR